MPFTLSHAAAVLPFRRTRLPWSALVIGSFGPDFEYFLRMNYISRQWHYYPDLFLYCLPFSVVAFFLFQQVIKRSFIRLLPRSFQQRLGPGRTVLPKSAVDFAWLLVALLIGLATHIFWDSLTHPYSWAWNRFDALRREYPLPLISPMYGFGIAQAISTLVGLVALGIWIALWYRNTAPAHATREGFSAPAKIVIWLTMLTLGALGALWRVNAVLGPPGGLVDRSIYRVLFVISSMAWFMWELVAFGLFTALSPQKKEAHR